MPTPKSERPPNPDPLLTTTEVAERLNVSRQVLYNWRTIGEGPPSFRVGTAVRYRSSELEEWISAQESAGAVARRTARDELTKARRGIRAVGQ